MERKRIEGMNRVQAAKTIIHYFSFEGNCRRFAAADKYERRGIIDMIEDLAEDMREYGRPDLATALEAIITADMEVRFGRTAVNHTRRVENRPETARIAPARTSAAPVQKKAKSEQKALMGLILTAATALSIFFMLVLAAAAGHSIAKNRTEAYPRLLRVETVGRYADQSDLWHIALRDEASGKLFWYESTDGDFAPGEYYTAIMADYAKTADIGDDSIVSLRYVNLE